jgi:hypothetical protein
MLKPAFWKALFALISALALFGVPRIALARHNAGSHGGGGSRGGSSHGRGASRGGGHSGFKGASFKGGGHSSGGFRGNSRVSSAHMGGARKNSGQISGGSFARSGGFASRLSGNFVRNSNLGGGSFGASMASRNSGRFGSSQPAAQNSQDSVGRWQSLGNSTGRSMLASARTSGNAMGGGWHSFGYFSRGGGSETFRGYGNSTRNESPWHSFGNSRNISFARNSSGFSSLGMSRAAESNTRSSSPRFSASRFSTNLEASSRFSSFPSFSSGRSMTNFRGSRSRYSGLGNSGFGNASFGRSGFSNSGVGSGVSLIPNLLSGFLSLGTSVFGGQGLLGANALSLAVRLFVSGIGAAGFGQGGSNDGDVGLGQGGFEGNFGFQATPVWPACDPARPFWASVPAPGVYCGPYAYQPFGWSSNGYLGDPRIGPHDR